MSPLTTKNLLAKIKPKKATVKKSNTGTHQPPAAPKPIKTTGIRAAMRDREEEKASKKEKKEKQKKEACMREAEHKAALERNEQKAVRRLAQMEAEWEAENGRLARVNAERREKAIEEKHRVTLYDQD
jgi:hypothetical protein